MLKRVSLILLALMILCIFGLFVYKFSGRKVKSMWGYQWATVVCAAYVDAYYEENNVYPADSCKQMPRFRGKGKNFHSFLIEDGTGYRLINIYDEFYIYEYDSLRKQTYRLIYDDCSVKESITC